MAATTVKVVAQEQGPLRGLGLAEGRVILDPIEALIELGGHALVLVDVLRQRVSELETVGTEPGRGYGESVKPEIVAYLNAIARAEKILTSLARLDLGARYIRLDEVRAQILCMVIERTLTAVGVDPQDADVRSHVHRELMLVGGAG